MATIIKVLNKNDERFAVKSGGHNPNAGFSSIINGPLISLKALNHITYDPKSKTASIGPGNRWSDVAKVLDAHGVAVASGRVGHVGVGGFLSGGESRVKVTKLPFLTLSGGLSYLSTQHGWAVNTVVEYEVVLANGDIVTASAKKNVDLFKALKGGGNNFGIATLYRMKAYETSTIWGGQVVSIGEHLAPAYQSAIRNFTESYPDSRAGITVSAFYNSTSETVVWASFFFFHGPAPPTSLFSEFFAIESIMNTWGQTTYYNFISALGNTSITGESVQILTETTTLPSAKYSTEVMGSYWDHFISTSKKYAPSMPDSSFLMTWQPIPKRLATASINAGGDVLALEDKHDRIMLELNVMTPPVKYDAQANRASRDLFDGIKKRVDGFVKAGKLADAYRPLFMNDANWQQDYFGRVRKEMRKFLKDVKDKYDSKGLFTKRTGGFKL